MKKITFLLPANFRFVGILFMLIGLIIGILRFYYGYKPEMLTLKTFAIYSSYLETKFMEVIGNNMGEELTGFFLLTGLFFLAFAREKIENEQTKKFRLRAFFLSAYANFIFLLVALFFTFGFGFIYMLMANIGFGLLVYVVAFRILVRHDQPKPEKEVLK
jgi:hypothetical protein